MCGIAGISSSGQDLLAVVRTMNASLRHRGPDDEGTVAISTPGAAAPECFLANSRLAILDLSSAGHQPMCSEHTGNWVVLNGEIYNHLQVREQLRESVTEWKSSSDTETVLRAFDVWGVDCVSRFRGMFAIAFWEAASASLWCVRDRLGIKPFYYFEGSGSFLFASEVRALLASGMVPRILDPIALQGYVRFGSFPEPYTGIAGVRSLGAGHLMRVRRGKADHAEPYWRIEEVIVDQSANAARRLRAELERSVREHLQSDVPVASFLSGGIDSTIITALAARSLAQQLRTYTVGFREADFDESPWAEKVARRYGTLHRKLLLAEEDIVRDIPAAVDAMDLASSDGLNTWVVSRAVAQDGIKVVLSGLGGDELFGGYSSFRVLPRLRRFSRVLGKLPHGLRVLIGGGERAAQITRRGTSLEDRYTTLRSLWANTELRKMDLKNSVHYNLAHISSSFAPLSRISVYELTGYMASTLLRDSDTMSMAHSLELRVPFLDHQFVENCLRMSVASGGDKRVLIDLAGDLLPAGLAKRPKKGFVLPLNHWMRGPLRDFVREGGEALSRSRALPSVFFSDLVERFEADKLGYARVWEFVTLGHWMRRHELEFDAAIPRWRNDASALSAATR